MSKSKKSSLLRYKIVAPGARIYGAQLETKYTPSIDDLHDCIRHGIWEKVCGYTKTRAELSDGEMQDNLFYMKLEILNNSLKVMDMEIPFFASSLTSPNISSIESG